MAYLVSVTFSVVGRELPGTSQTAVLCHVTFSLGPVQRIVYSDNSSRRIEVRR